jgi:hypothetical protein
MADNHSEEIPVMWTIQEFNKFRFRFNSLLTHNEDSLDPEFVKKSRKAMEDFLVLNRAQKIPGFSEFLVFYKEQYKAKVTQASLLEVSEKFLSKDHESGRLDFLIPGTLYKAFLIKKKIFWEWLLDMVHNNKKFQSIYMQIPEHYDDEDRKELADKFEEDLIHNWSHKPAYLSRLYMSFKDHGITQRYSKTKATKSFLIFYK